MIKRPRQRRTRVWIVGLAVASALGACSVQDSLPPPDCLEGEAGLIVAQSVPSADLIPCLTPLPAGWDISTVRVGEDGTVIRFDSDRAGSTAAVLRFATTCEPGPAVPVSSDQEGTERFDDIEEVDPALRASRYYLFPGGCVWWVFDFDDDAPAALAVELGNSLTLITRAALNENIRRSFIDEEL